MTTNWKNVNNWHWVEKNCVPWAKEYFKKTFVGLKEEENGNTIEITEIKKFSGDVDINQRKGKILTIYDIELELGWEGKTSDNVEVKGKLHIPEIAHDTEEDDYVFDVTIENETSEKRVIRELIRNKLSKTMKNLLSKFSGDLVKAHGNDVYIPPEKMKGHPANTMTNIVINKNEQKSKNESSKQKETISIGTWNKKITIKDEFFTSAHELYETFINPDRVKAWTRHPGSFIEPKEGGKFEFWGNISGEITKLIPDNSIVMKWRMKEFPENHYTTVTMNFIQENDRVTLKVDQTGLRSPYDDQVKSNWVNYYFNPIKTTFGFGLVM